MRDLYLEAVLLGCQWPSSLSEFAELLWLFATGWGGFRLAWDDYDYKNQRSTYAWYGSRREIDARLRSSPVSLDEWNALVLYSPRGFPFSAPMKWEEMRARDGWIADLGWGLIEGTNESFIRVGGILIGKPRGDLAKFTDLYLSSLKQITLDLVPRCKPALVLCGEQRFEGAIERGNAKALARRRIWKIDWVNVFGPSYVEKFGKEFLLAAPGFFKVEFLSDHVLYQPTEGFLPGEASNPSPGQIEGYFSTHAMIGKVAYRPWLASELGQGARSRRQAGREPSEE